MGSRLFRTLVGVGISLGGTATGCLGQSDDAGESAPLDPTDTGSGGTGDPVVEGSSAGTTLSEVSAASTTSMTTTGRGSSATVGSTSAGGSSGGSDATLGHGVSGTGATGGDAGSSGADPGSAGQGGDGPDPFCDTTWPTTKGNPPVPECVDPEHLCQNELPLRCLIPVGEFACDGHFEHSYAPLCKNGVWECEPGLVPVTECKCLAPIAEGFVCTENGVLPLEGTEP